MTRRLAIIFIGPPGSGKSTQANEIAARFEGFFHFDLGHIIERTLYNPQNQDDPIIRMERQRFESGGLSSTPWVMALEKEHIGRIAQDGKGVIFSGSPRIREEAEFLTPLLRELYGEGGVLVFHLIVGEASSLFRNTRRRVCEDCNRAVVWSRESEELAYCTFCGGKLVKRTLDTQEAIKQRFLEYAHRMEGILAYFVAVGVPIVEINAEDLPEKVTENIELELKKIIQ